MVGFGYGVVCGVVMYGYFELQVGIVGSYYVVVEVGCQYVIWMGQFLFQQLVWIEYVVEFFVICEVQFYCVVQCCF